MTGGLFLVASVFLLLLTFADMLWAFWVGFGFAIAAGGFYVLLVLENRKSQKKPAEPEQSNITKTKKEA